MDLDRIRPVAAPVAVFVLLGLALFLLFKFWTASPSIIRSDVAANISMRYYGQETGDEATENAPADTSNPVAVQTELLQQNVFSGLTRWAATLLTLALVLAVGWSLLAAYRERVVFGPGGQSSLLVAWIGGALIYGAGVVAAYFLVLVPANLGASIAATDVALATVGTGLAGLLGYWLATAYGASPVMRPSVPFSFLIRR
jgi:hypothetical protein